MQAQDAYRDSLKDVLQTSLPDTARVRLLLDLCSANVQSQPDTAVVLGERALQLSNDIDYIEGKARSHYLLGYAFDFAGDADKGRSYLLKSIPFYEEAGNIEFVGNAYNATGVSFYYSGDLASSLEYYDKAAAHFEKHGIKKRLAGTLNNVAIIYRNNKKYDEAIQTHLRAIRVKEELNDSAGLFNSHFNIGKAYVYTDQFDSAFFHLDKSLTYVNSPDSLVIAEINSAKGEVSKNSGKSETALEYLDKALEYFKFHPETTGMDVLYAYKAIALSDLGRKSEALEVAEKGFAFLDHQSPPMARQTLLRLMSELHASQGRYESAYRLLEESEAMEDSLRNDKQMKLVEEMEAKFEARERENTIALQKTELEKTAKEKQYLYLVSILVILLLLTVGAVAWQRIKRVKQLNEKNAIIQKNLTEKEVLLREIHHRVKNNLQVVSSLLSIQSREIKDQKALEAVNESRNRVKSMAIIHQNLYREDNLTGVEAKDYIEKLSSSLFNSYNVSKDKVTLQTELEPVILDVDLSIPLGLILNELISNTLKHAFPNDAPGVLKISLWEENEDLIVQVQDNGIGLPSDFGEKDSFGMKMVKAFARKLKAELNFSNDNGTVAELRVPQFKQAAKNEKA